MVDKKYILNESLNSRLQSIFFLRILNCQKMQLWTDDTFLSFAYVCFWTEQNQWHQQLIINVQYWTCG